MKILSFNILAPIFASDEWFPDEINKKYLNDNRRLRKIIKFIVSKKDDTHIMCFQEVTCREFNALKEVLSHDFEGCIAFHDKEYWKDSIVKPFQYRPHGNAIFIKSGKSIKFIDLSLKTGNHCIGATFEYENKIIRVFSLHLDSDYESNRVIELSTLLKFIKNSKGSVDIIEGDINSEVKNNKICKLFKDNNFKDTIKGSTHPWDPILNDPSFAASIDHILVRGIKCNKGKIYNFGIMKYENEIDRINLTLKLLGSDHFPISCKINI
jgi:mRNA deadenylase 3'-5' endonuclease subunit Ccr4